MTDFDMLNLMLTHAEIKFEEDTSLGKKVITILGEHGPYGYATYFEFNVDSEKLEYVGIKTS